jgi:hypothetical protein
MKLFVDRDQGDKTEKSIVSEILADGSRFGYVLELPWKNNMHDISCIPSGMYFVRLLPSPHFDGAIIPHIMYVPNRTDIMIHVANWPYEIKGCMAIGLNKGVDYVGQSRKAFDALMGLIKKSEAGNEDVTIDIRGTGYEVVAG